MSSIAWMPRIAAECQVPTPPVVSVDVSTWSPLPPAAMHTDTDGHVILSSALEATCVMAQAELPVGSAELTISPAASTAAHIDTDGQDMPVSAVVPSIPAMTQESARLPAGSVDTATPPPDATPCVPIATHSDADPHERSANSGPGWNEPPLQAPAPPVGLLEVTIAPVSSLVAQNESVGQDTTPCVAGPQKLLPSGPVSHTWLESTPTVLVQALAPPVGLVEVSASAPDTPTHNVSEGHATLANCCVLSTFA